ncbi:ABC transporter permease [Roseomonas xinghualingensis]|uniref:ABC transporter permease n=1 Tax=Roseomonas xinghualingensis TaxID=2986475 RepID=UPI0021F15816|nr:ABC transporter permease [Roseomonas sp. SXEYE001]MCV4208858.1 ABC transporter permease [Roseomonas sp. SXEYE001]
MIWKALANQRRIVGAILLRESRTRFGRTRLGYLWALAEPISHVMVMSVVYWAINRRAPVGDNVILFFVTGVLPYFLFQKTARNVGGALRGGQTLLRLPLVNGMDLVVGRALLEAVTWLCVTLIILGFMVSTGRAHMPDHPLVCAAAVIATFGLGFGVGLVNAVIMTMWKSWVMIYPMITKPLYHFSAIFFFIDRIPADLRYWLSWNPLMHGVQWFRQGYITEYASVTLDANYLLKWAIASILIGLCLERVTQRQVQSA